MVTARFLNCDRIREAISAQLDGELSELESARLRTHLDRCESCRDFEVSTRLASEALRTAPLEQPARPVALPSRRRISLPMRVPAAAAAAVVMVAAGGVFESMHGGAAIRGSRPSQAAAFSNVADTRALAKRQQQANFQKLLILRAQFESNRMPRHPGFQNP